MKGEFEKRCCDYRPILCVHAPEEDEKGNITQKVYKTFRLPTREEIKQAIDEAQKEIDLKHIKKIMNNYPEREWWTEIQRLVPILEKWFRVEDKNK